MIFARSTSLLALAATAALAAAGAIATPVSAEAQLRGAVDRAAGRAVIRNAERRATQARAGTQSCRAIPQKCAGMRREEAARRILASRYPNERIQSESFLRNRDGSIARDPRTGEARRVDYVLFADGRVSRRFEVTSQHSDKRAQLAKEVRIFERHADGTRRRDGVYVRDRATGRLVPVNPGPSQVIRFH